MGICLGQAPMTISSFCLFRVKTVPSEEDSASCEVLAGLIQSLIAVSSANYPFSSKPSLRQIQSLIAVSSANYAFSSKPSLRQPLKTFRKEIMLNFRYSG